MTAADAWLILGTFVVLWVGGFDAFAHFNHSWSMTHQMDVWIQNTVTGPFVVWLWTGAPFAWAFHLWQSRNHLL